ncbi:hypothetical protein [Caudoviricetes sp.]|nr:hypothetical protein [Caudoviricetes sp.]
MDDFAFLDDLDLSSGEWAQMGIDNLAALDPYTSVDASWQGDNWSGAAPALSSPSNADIAASWGGGGGLLSSLLGGIPASKLAELGFGTVAGMYAANERRDAAARTEEERLRTRQRIADSISGSKMLNQASKQIAAPSPLTRVGGGRVYTNEGGLV